LSGEASAAYTYGFGCWLLATSMNLRIGTATVTS
jgi:hypothetical protein